MEGLLTTIKEAILEMVATSVKIIPALIGGLIILCLTRYAAGYAERLGSAISHRATNSPSLQLLLMRATSITVWVIGILLACLIVFPGLGLGDIIATLGLGSVAIGFAFQDIFKNFLAGILLLLQQPFRINDQVIINDYEGTVEGIDIRTTQLRTYQGERIILPNSTVFTSPVRVRTAYESRRTDLAVGVDYNTPLPKAAKLLEQVIRSVEGVLDNPEPEIDLVSFGDSSIDFVVRYWTVPQQKQVRHVQTRAIIAIKKVFDEAEINIPYPIRTLYFYNQDKYNDYFPTSQNGKDEKEPEFNDSFR